MIEGRVNSRVQSQVQVSLQRKRSSKVLTDQRKAFNRFETAQQMPGVRPPDFITADLHPAEESYQKFLKQINKHNKMDRNTNMKRPAITRDRNT